MNPFVKWLLIFVPSVFAITIIGSIIGNPEISAPFCLLSSMVAGAIATLISFG